MTNPAHELLREHATGIRALAAGTLGDGDLADDVVQDTWLAAAQHPPGDDRNRRGWLYVVARNLARRRRRTEHRRRSREVRAARPERLPSTAELAERMELEQHLIAALKSLHEPYRSTLMYRYFDDLSPTEIARHHGIPVKTVKTRLNRGLAQLRARLDGAYAGRRRAWALPMGALALPGPSTNCVGTWLTGGLAVKKAAVVLGIVLIGSLLILWNDPNGELGSSQPDGGMAGAAAPGAPKLETNRAPEETDPTVDVRDRIVEGGSVPANSYAGRVVTAGGTGVAGARVRLVYFQAPPVSYGVHNVMRRERERHEDPTTYTDPDGYFRIDRPEGAQSYLRVTAEGYSHVVSGRHPAGSFALITLQPDEWLRVRVRTDDGSLLGRALVRLVTSTRPGTFPMSTRQVLGETRTDTRGIARVPVPCDSGLLIEVAPDESGLGLVETPVKKAQAELDVVVPGVRIVKRRIVDAESGLPVTDAYVDVFKTYEVGSFENEPWRRRFLADEDGWVRFPHQEGFYKEFASAPGYLIAHAWDEPIRLRRGMRIDGVVLDPKERPVADASILVCLPRGPFDRVQFGLSPVAAWSDAEGRFSCEVKLPGPAHGDRPDLGVRSVVALHPSHAPAVVDSIAVEPGKRVELTLRFPEAASLALELVDEAGRPLAEVQVYVSRQIPRAGSWPPADFDFGVDLMKLLRVERHKTDEGGRCLVEGLPLGPHFVRVQNTIREVTLEAGKRTSLRMVQGQGPSIGVRVVNAAGKPVEKIQVGLSGPRAWAGYTDKDGWFRFKDLKPGDYRVGVLVRGPRGGYAFNRPARPGLDVTLNLPAGPARLRINVDLPADVLPEFSLMTEPGGYEPASTGFAPMRGRPFLTDGFTPGKGVLVVRAKGFGWTAVPFEAPEDATTDVHVSLPLSGAVEGRIEGGLATKSHYVRLHRKDGWPDPITGKRLEYAISRSRGNADYDTRPKEDGEFEFPDVNPGEYDISYGRWDERTWKPLATETVTVKSGERASAVLKR